MSRALLFLILPMSDNWKLAYNESRNRTIDLGPRRNWSRKNQCKYSRFLLTFLLSFLHGNAILTRDSITLPVYKFHHRFQSPSRLWIGELHVRNPAVRIDKTQRSRICLDWYSGIRLYVPKWCGYFRRTHNVSWQVVCSSTPSRLEGLPSYYDVSFQV
jgi:hypothetical protein